MSGAAHHRRGGNNTGYVRTVRLSSGEARFHARLRNEWLGSYETRGEALKAVDRARKRLGLDQPTDNEVA